MRGCPRTVTLTAGGRPLIVALALLMLPLMGAASTPMDDRLPTDPRPDVEYGRDHIFVERDDGIGRLLRPNISTLTDGSSWDPVRVRTNAEGLRDAPIPPRREDELRVLVIGDSFTFGTGIRPQDRYSELVQTRLRLRYQRPVTVITAGIPTWGMKNYYHFLRERGLDYEPDIVVVGFISNDRWSYRQMRQLYAATRPNATSEAIEFYRAAQQRMQDTTAAERGFRYLDRIDTLLEHHDIPPVYYALDLIREDETVAYLRGWEQQSGHRILHAPRLFTRYWPIKFQDRSYASPYRISATNGDPSRAGHALLAGPLYRRLVWTIGQPGGAVF